MANTVLKKAPPTKIKRKKIKLTPYLLLLPWIIGILVFRAYPIFMSFWYSLHSMNLIADRMDFVGAGNYTFLLGFDHFHDSLRATLRYVLIGTPMVLVTAFFVAFILNFKLKGINLFRTAYYVPSILGGNVAVAIVWGQVFSGNGPVNTILRMIPGLDAVSWIGNPTFAPFTLIFLSAWQFGSVMLIFLASLQNVSPSLYEAASIDGAKRMRQLFSITLPIITPVVFFNTINVLLRHFQEFNSPFLITNRGPNRATDFLNVLIFDFAFQRMRFGEASAMTWALLSMIGVLTLILWISQKYWVHYSD